jgi:hypothetical protein
MFNTYNYSELNPQLNYKKNVDQDIPSFEKTQNNNTQDNYYCGGKSTYAIGGMRMNNTKLSVTYFSDKNIAKIQEMIKISVYRESKGKFRLDVDQDESDLLVTMRYIYIEHALHLPTHIKEQVNVLNKKTINYIVPDMLTNIKQQYMYLKDISEPIKTIDRPLNVSSRKQLPSTTNIWSL